MPGPVLVDLDQRPDLLPSVLGLFQVHGPGRTHAVSGIPLHMGQKVRPEDFQDCLGTAIMLDGQRVAGALAVCPYSEEQATLWGPVTASGYALDAVGRRLVQETRQALRDGGYTSIRALVDTRNRAMRTFLLAQGFAVWKDSHICLRSLARAPANPEGVRASTRRDHSAAAALLAGAFQDSEHCRPNLVTREKEGYRHYVVAEEGMIVGAAAVQNDGKRSWIKLIAVRPDLRRRGTGGRLLSGIIHAENALGQREIGLEVLADNPGANTAFARAGFKKRWSFTILTGPV